MNLKPLYEVTRRDFRNQHLYSDPNDKRFTDVHSVSHFLGVISKPALVGWAAREALDGVRRELYGLLGTKTTAMVELDISWVDDLMDKATARPEKVKVAAADLGTMTHNVADEFIRTGRLPEDMDPGIKTAVSGFTKWFNVGRKIVAGDTYVMSKLHRYAGAFDSVITDPDGKLALIDFKTSKSARYTEYALQTAAYIQAFKETYGIECERAHVVRFNKVAPVGFEVATVLDHKKSFEAFLHAKNLKENISVEHFA